MTDRFSPIEVGKVAPAPTRVHTSLLEPARLASMHLAMDETADFAQTLPSHIKPTDIDELTTQAERRETTLRRMVSYRDTHDALEWLHDRGEFTDDFWHRLEEVEMEMAEKRLNRSQG